VGASSSEKFPGNEFPANQKKDPLEKIGPNCSWWVEFFTTNPSQKICERQIDSSPQGFFGKNKKYLSCHHLVYHGPVSKANIGNIGMFCGQKTISQLDV